jgi:hypothetical protein
VLRNFQVEQWQQGVALPEGSKTYTSIINEAKRKQEFVSDSTKFAVAFGQLSLKFLTKSMQHAEIYRTKVCCKRIVLVLTRIVK